MHNAYSLNAPNDRQTDIRIEKNGLTDRHSYENTHIHTGFRGKVRSLLLFDSSKSVKGPLKFKVKC